MSTSILDAALYYASLGYPVFPCVPDGKTPLTEHGFHDASTDQTQILEWWEMHPRANVAIATEGLAVLDIDGAANRWPGNDEPDSQDRAASLSDAPAIAMTPRGGSHYIWRQPEGANWRCTVSELGHKVDTRADGGYIVAAPSTFEGKPYAWIDGLELDCPLEALPTPPEWLCAAIEALMVVKRGVPRPTPLDRRSGDDGIAGEDEDAGDTIPKGQRNGTLASIAGSLRRISLGKSAILAALLEINRQRCVPPLSEREVRKIAGSVARYEPDQFATAAAEGHFAQMVSGTGGEGWDSNGGASDLIKDPGEFPAHLLHVPGFVAEVMAYTLATAHRPLPQIALGGALALLGTLTGRKVRDAANTRTNIYVLGVAPSGGGKDWPRTVNKNILHRAGADHLLGPEEIASSAGLSSAVEEKPALLLQLDELGRHLKTMSDPRNAHLYGIATVLMKLYSSASTIYAAGGYADTKRNKMIYQPHVCLFATTVPKSFHEGLTPDNISDGFLSRMLVFEAGFVPKAVKRMRAGDIPASIIEAAQWWAEYRPGGNLTGQYPDPRAVPITPEAQAVFDWLDDEADRLTVALGEPLGTVWTRATEQATKLALLYACSANACEPVVDEPAALWACELAYYLIAKRLHAVTLHVAENDFDARRLRVLRIIVQAGAAGITKYELCRRTRSLPVKDREEIVKALLACQDITESREPTGGRARTVYVASAHSTGLQTTDRGLISFLPSIQTAPLSKGDDG